MIIEYKSSPIVLNINGFLHRYGSDGATNFLYSPSDLIEEKIYAFQNVRIRTLRYFR